MKKWIFLSIALMLVLLTYYVLRVHVFQSSKITFHNQSESTVTDIYVFIDKEVCSIEALLPNEKFSCWFYPESHGQYKVVWSEDTEQHSLYFGFAGPDNNYGDLAAFKGSGKVVHSDDHYF